MKVSLKSVLLTFLILVIIGILIFFNYFYFKLSPVMLYEDEDKEILEIFKERNNLDNLELESRYALENIYYSAVDDNFVYIFINNGNLIFKINKEELNYDQALKSAEIILGDAENKISLAVYKEKPIYVIINKDYDVFIDFYNYNEVFRYRKGISNE